MSENPWGQVPRSTGTSLSSIMSQQGAIADGELALALHNQLNPLETVSQQPPENTIDPDEMLARQLQKELNDTDNPETINDALLAAFLQNEIDADEFAREEHLNGGSNITVSAFSGVREKTISDVSEEREQSFYEYPEEEPDSSKTKHDLRNNNIKQKQKISDTFNLEYKSGDFRDVSVPHKVYNEMKVEAHKSKYIGIRVKDKRDVSTHVQVLDKKTRVVMLKMLNSGIVSKINGNISTGKESVIIHCNGGRVKHKDAPVPNECVFKIHKTSLNEFSRRRDYMDRRYTSEVKNRTKKLIEIWTLKEVHNLNRLRRAGIMCPEVVAHRKQLILMSFIGCNGVPAPTLKHVHFNTDQLRSAYQQLISGMKTMFTKCKLVHGDLSPYNLLWHNGVLHFIDLSQAVLIDHPSALTYLHRDCQIMYDYFKMRNLKNVMDPKEMFCHVTEFQIKYTDETSFVTQIEHLQRQEVYDFKHGSSATDYAFETSFNESLVLNSDSEEEDDDDDDDNIEDNNIEETSDCRESTSSTQQN